MIHFLLTDQNINLIYDEISKISSQSFSPAILELTSNTEYIVSFNGVEYTLIAQEKVNDTKTIVFIGNEFLVQDTNKPPFLIQYVYDSSTEEYTTEIYYNDNLTSAIISVSVDLEKVDIIFYNKRGKPVSYSNIDTISMDTVIPNAQATFIRGSAVQPFEQELNMKDGNQVVESNGAFFKSATIIKPETLIPENIKKGIDIGGVEGTFEIQGVSKTAEIDFATEYTKAYNRTDVSNFKVAENEGKYIRIMYEPYDGLFGESVEQYAYYRCDLSGSSYTLTKVETGLIPLKNSQEIKADIGTSLTEVVITKPETLIAANIRKNVDIGGVSGDFIGNGYSHTINNLNF